MTTMTDRATATRVAEALDMVRLTGVSLRQAAAELGLTIDDCAVAVAERPDLAAQHERVRRVLHPPADDERTIETLAALDAASRTILRLDGVCTVGHLRERIRRAPEATRRLLVVDARDWAALCVEL